MVISDLDLVIYNDNHVTVYNRNCGGVATYARKELPCRLLEYKSMRVKPFEHLIKICILFEMLNVLYVL